MEWKEFLQKEANQIKKCERIYPQATRPIDVPVQKFITLFKNPCFSKDKDLLLGFCYSIGPYVSQNYAQITKSQINEIWEGIIIISKYVIEQPEICIYGFCEAVSSICFHFFEISDKFKSFLEDSNQLCSKIKPPILIALYNDLPQNFIFMNTKVFAPIVIDYLIETKDYIQRIFTLTLINALDLTNSSDLVQKIPNFVVNIWSSIYEIVLNEPNLYYLIIGPFLLIRKKNPQLFENSIFFINNKINEIEANSTTDENMQKIVPLIRFIPFISMEDVENLMKKVFPILSYFIYQNSTFPKSVTSALNDIQHGIKTNSQVLLKLYSMVCNYIETEFFPSVIYFLGIFADKFSIFSQQGFSAIIEKVIIGLESNYPLKFPMAFAIAVNVDFISHKIEKEVLKNRIIPLLFQTGLSTQKSDAHWAFKALWSLLLCGNIKYFPSSKQIVEMYSKVHCECLHAYFKMICDYVRCSPPQSEIDVISEFVLNLLPNENSFKDKQNSFNNSDNSSNDNNSNDNNNSNISDNLNENKNSVHNGCLSMCVKTDICLLIRILCRSDKVNCRKYVEPGFALAKEMFFSDYTNSYFVAFHLIGILCEIEKSFDITDIIVRANKIGSQQIATSPEVQREVVYNFYHFSSPPYSIPCPLTFIDIFLTLEPPFQIVGLALIERYFDKLDFETTLIQYVPILALLVKESKVTDVVNDSFIILSKIINKYNLNSNNLSSSSSASSSYFPIDEIDDVLRTYMQGRITLLDHLMPYNYDNRRFKFYRFVSNYIAKFPNKSKWILDDMSIWILRASDCMLPKLIKVLEIALTMKLIDVKLSEDLFSSISARIDEDNSNCSLIISGISFLLKLKKKYPQHFELTEFLSFLEKIWEDNDQEGHVLEFLVPVFLDLFAEKTFDIQGDFEIFHDITSIVVAETFHFDYQKIINYFIQMHQNEIMFDSFSNDSSVVFVHFLVKNTKVLLESGFQIETLQNMHRCLKQTFKNNKMAEKFVDNYFASNQTAMERIKYLKKSPTLPEF